MPTSFNKSMPFMAPCTSACFSNGFMSTSNTRGVRWLLRSVFRAVSLMPRIFQESILEPQKAQNNAIVGLHELATTRQSC